MISALLCISGAACAPAPDDAAAGSEALQGGTVDVDDPAIGIVWSTKGGCTGFLIAPDLVLTAAHCAEDPLKSFDTGDHQPGAGGHPTPMTKHPIDGQRVYPGYVPQCPNPSGDLAIAHLAAPIDGVEPLTTAQTSADEPHVGDVCRAVGFGKHAGGPDWAKRSAKSAVAEIKDGFLTAQWADEEEGGIADSGDSGGPLLCGGTVVGTVECHKDGSFPVHKRVYYSRVSAFSSWIASTVATWPPDKVDGS